MSPVVSTLLAVSLALTGLVSWGADDGSRRQTLTGQKPLVIGHRGAPGYLPDHTLEGYRRAMALGADFIEPDLVITRDGVLVVRHEPNIIATTDVAQHPEFADRKRSAVIDGRAEQGWFASDFTLAELKTLRAVQPLAERDPGFNGRYSIPTFDEVLALAQSESARLGRPIGVYPEIKHSTYHARLGLPLEDRLLDALTQRGLTRKDSPVIIQSFETGNLKYLRGKTAVRLVQLLGLRRIRADGTVEFGAPGGQPYDLTVAGDARDYGALITPAGLAEVKTYADGIGPPKVLLVPTRLTVGPDGKPIDLNGDGLIDERDRRVMPPTKLLADAHRAGLFVHPYTFRSEAKRLAADDAGDARAEYRRFYALGVDGVFSDFPDDAKAARDD